MKKILSILLAVALVLSFAGCGNDSTNDANANAQNNSSSQSGNKTSNKPSVSSNPLLSSNSSTASYAEKPQFPVSEEDVYSFEVVRYKLNDECRGFYFTPKAAGKYPTVIIMHGQGSIDRFRERLLSNFNNWVKAGYLPPMVVVMPEILNYTGGGSNMQDFQFFIDSEYPNRFATLLTSVETGALSSQIGTDKPFYVTGFSMGGMAAVHAGAEYNTRVKHVGGLSPSMAFYMGEDSPYGFYKKVADIHFAPDAKVYLAAGYGEQNSEFVYTINRYERAIETNTPDIVTKYAAPVTWGGHSFALAQREIFMYLYFATFGEVPSQAFVEAVCNNPDEYTIPKIVQKEEEHTN